MTPNTLNDYFKNNLHNIEKNFVLFDYFLETLDWTNITRDHICPKSNDGKNCSKNINILSAHVNNKKGHLVEFEIEINDYSYIVEIHENFLFENEKGIGIYYFKKVTHLKTKRVVLKNKYLYNYKIYKLYKNCLWENKIDYQKSLQNKVICIANISWTKIQKINTNLIGKKLKPKNK